MFSWILCKGKTDSASITLAMLPDKILGKQNFKTYLC